MRSGRWLVAAVVLFAACGGPEEFDDGELATSSDELRIDFQYQCYGYGASQGQQLGLKLKTSKATVTRGTMTAVGSYDSSYRPPSGSTDKRYKSFTGWTGAPATPTLLVSASLRTGGAALRTGGVGGFATVRYGRSSVQDEKFVCRLVTTPAAPSPEVPIPYVLQWINDYRGTGGTVTRLNLKRDGTYDATVQGKTEHGAFFGPRQIPTTQGIDLKLVANDGTEWSAHLTLYSGTSAVVSRAGRSATLRATLPTDGEDACDTGGGSYADDDAVGGLYCVCPDGMSWIPALGGCVN